MTLFEQVRAACELLHEVALVQIENGYHPDAEVAARWLDHVGGAAAWQAVDRASLGPHEATALTLPLCEVPQ